MTEHAHDSTRVWIGHQRLNLGVAAAPEGLSMIAEVAGSAWLPEDAAAMTRSTCARIAVDLSAPNPRKGPLRIRGKSA